jgi:replicative DNA helicase
VVNSAGVILRDRWTRPLLVPATGGPAKPYTRASTLGGTLEDQTNIGEWKKRVVAFGLARRRDLILAAASVPSWDGPQNKRQLSEIAEQAMQAAEANAAATIGTALHALTDRLDRGEPIPDVGDDRRALDAYAQLMRGFDVHAIELFLACDELEVAGTTDRVLSPKEVMTAPDGTRITPDDRLIGDLKGLSLDTPLPTPTGWTTMGAVQVGDEVLGSDGRPCRVTAKSATKRIGTYVVEFNLGDSIVCDREHLWWVMTGLSHQQGMREQVLDAETLAGSVLNRNGKALHRVPVAAPLDLPPADLPIDPYLLGCWLGDGTHNNSRITKGDDLFEVLEADGHDLGVRGTHTGSDQAVTRSVIGLVTKLREVGLYENKHIPDTYLRGSIEQRVRLLQGLMDTDGSVARRNQQAHFDSCDKALALQVQELCVSLGLKVRLKEGRNTGFGKTVTSYRVQFTPRGFMPFRLPRKVSAMAERTASPNRSGYRTITAVTPGPDVETACIAVDSPNRTYLCGRDMIPTHNTSATADWFGIKYCVQLAGGYAHGEPYVGSEDEEVRAAQEAAGINPFTQKAMLERIRGHRPGWPDGIAPRQDWGLIVHVPSGGSTATLHWVNLRLGWELAQLACTVREWRKRKDLVVPAEPPRVPLSTALNGAGLASLIDAVDPPTPEAFNALWAQHKSAWTPAHTAQAQRRARVAS